ncbi:MAG: dihydrolipoyl dehydrogenase [Actinobacteria bacterium]|nr:dihydrolipoyl dehydrogenase [Actinomycetota bacterium]
MTSILVLGGGPAGYVAAGRAAQLGAEVTLVEAREVGGTCLNRGCIPTKAMVAGAARLHEARRAAEYGVLVPEVGLDFAAFMARKEAATAQLRAGVEHLLRARKVQVVAGRGTLAGPGRVSLAPGAVLADGTALADGGELEGDAVILASGSEPVRMDLFDWRDQRVMTSDELLEIDHVPAGLAIVGGGVIGCEFASVFNRLGSEVTVIEMLPQLLPGEDQRVGRSLQQAFRKAGIAVHVKTAVESVETTPDRVTLHLAGGAAVTAEAVLVAVGRRPVSAGLGYEEAGVRTAPGGFVVVVETCRTSLPGVFAAGDVAGPPLLAHWAYHQGAVAAENAATGSRLEVDRSVVPNCVFSSPEVASCGLTEDRAKAEGVEHEVAHVRFNGNSKAVCDGDADGFVRIVCEPDGGRVLGASLFGPHVTELVHELALAIRNRLTLEDVAATIHAHPTLSEAIGEAVLSGLGRGVHSI